MWNTKPVEQSAPCIPNTRAVPKTDPLAWVDWKDARSAKQAQSLPSARAAASEAGL